MTELEVPLSVGDWMVTILITIIPCVNLIMLFVWAFGGGTKKSKSNWAKAQLLWMLIIMVVVFVLYFVIGVAVFSLIQQRSYY